MTRNLLGPLAFAVALAFGGGASARAGVIYSSFGPGMSYGNGNIGGPNYSIPNARGFQFTAASDGQVASYDLALRTYGALPAGAFTIQIVADAGGDPDFAAILDSATINLASIELTTIYNLTSSTGASLTAGSRIGSSPRSQAIAG